ncbi:23S rRNA (adenine(2030)-N(6))-methyltransferase RlmJ [Polynucleobacter paludilacus]|uniref:23S rRNA (adenine(2030)-N(6))-methyltransferase RlmJ n=1 Tax=Polynucleobacter paludilacus TaxID=1855895 RepID=UPI001BFDE821|nr:23S rRNA (adenine(2030)-N(6))-methyltransferase RlmJ [Polynucleobacter paludilacus]QWD87584.1 23S rRNA (adenine(2030)-N(6))-methyltransferase RlmJ [Polynucleobacter paludilacus]
MFSYRHAFHAGSHADILKHIVLIQLIRYLQEKEGALTIIDTHAGAGIYSLSDGFAAVSKEAEGGIFRLSRYLHNNQQTEITDSISEYMAAITAENPSEELAFYPGSPFIIAKMLRPQDRLKLFELHPKEIDLLRHNVQQLPQNKQIDLYHADSFSRLKGLVPPPSRRGLVLIDPSYEDKQDYRYLESTLEEALSRFATGCYAIWYPILSRRESAALPDRLQKIAAAHKRSWLQAELRVESSPGERRLQASGMFVLNPPWTLEGKLKEALPALVKVLGHHSGAEFVLKSVEA